MVVDGEFFTTPTLTFNSSSYVNKVPYMYASGTLRVNDMS